MFKYKFYIQLAECYYAKYQQNRHIENRLKICIQVQDFQCYDLFR